jgi:5-hydroxyisourate hydrolase
VSGISTHVLDLAAGTPARDVPVQLDVQSGAQGWVTLAKRVTDADGRARDLIAGGARLDAGTYRLTFGTGAYFAAQGRPTFFPEAIIVFEVHDASQNYHVPLLLSPFGYSTYRGS